MSVATSDTLDALGSDDLLAELQRLRAGIAEVDRTRDALYARRLQVFRILRGREVKNGPIAAAAGTSEVAVIQALRKDDERRAKAREESREGSPTG